VVHGTVRRIEARSVRRVPRPRQPPVCEAGAASSSTPRSATPHGPIQSAV
jgi:hypothetical protein